MAFSFHPNIVFDLVKLDRHQGFHLNEKEPLLEDEMKKVPELQDLTIFKEGEVRRGIHKVEPRQGRVIESLLSQHR